MRRRGLGFVVAAAVVTILAWAGLAWLSRIADPAAVQITRDLFGWTILETAIAAGAVVVMLARDRRVAALRGATAAIAALMTVAAFEAPAALGLVHWGLAVQRLTGTDIPFGWRFDSDPARGWRRHPGDRFSGPSVSDIEQGWLLRPARRETLTFTYDGWGYRNPHTLERAEVVLLGDSYVEGYGVQDHEVVARRLEARLGAPVQNMGVAGYGTHQALLVLEEDAVKLQPKLAVWFFFEGNDLFDDQLIESMRMAPIADRTHRPEGMTHYHGWRQRSFVAAALDGLRFLADPALPNRAPYWATLATRGLAGETILFADYAKLAWTDYVEARWGTAQANFHRAANFARERGIALAFAFVPTKERVYWPYVILPDRGPLRRWTIWPMRERFLAFCAEAGVPCLDLTDTLQADVKAGGWPYLRTDTHWSPRGHELVATRLAALVQMEMTTFPNKLPER